MHGEAMHAHRLLCVHRVKRDRAPRDTATAAAASGQHSPPPKTVANQAPAAGPLRVELAAAQLQVHLFHSCPAPAASHTMNPTPAPSHTSSPEQAPPPSSPSPPLLHPHHTQVTCSGGTPPNTLLTSPSDLSQQPRPRGRRLLRRAMLLELRPSAAVPPPVDSSGHAPAAAPQLGGGCVKRPDGVPGG